jgi:hypothetical protein
MVGAILLTRGEQRERGVPMRQPVEGRIAIRAAALGMTVSRLISATAPPRR